MSLYTDKFVQTGNSCGAATLMIALHEKDSKNPVDAQQEKILYDKTIEKDDDRLKGHGYSSPKNIIATAKEFGLEATLYKTDDIKLAYLDQSQQQQLHDFVDTQGPKNVSTDQLISLLNQGALQILTFIDSDQESKHWLLLRKQEGSRSKYYYLYDTALGSNTELEIPKKILTFFSDFESSDKSRDYTFLGVAIHLK